MIIFYQSTFIVTVVLLGSTLEKVFSTPCQSKKVTKCGQHKKTNVWHPAQRATSTGAELMTEFCSPSLEMVTSPYGSNFLKRDVQQLHMVTVSTVTTAAQSFFCKISVNTPKESGMGRDYGFRFIFNNVQDFAHSKFPGIVKHHAHYLVLFFPMLDPSS